MSRREMRMAFLPRRCDRDGRALAHLTQRDIENEWTGAAAERAEKGRAFDQSMLRGLRTIIAGLFCLDCIA